MKKQAAPTQAPVAPARGTWASVRLWVLAALVLGMVIGAAAMRAFGGASSAAGAARAAITLAPDCSGRIEEWVLALPDMHQSRAMFLPTQADIVAAADPGIRFSLIYAEDRRKAEMQLLLRARGVQEAARIRWVRSRQSLNPWVRDYLLMARRADGRAVALTHHPDHYRLARGSWRVEGPDVYLRAFDSTESLGTRLHVEGGEVVADEERIFATAASFETAVRRKDATDERAALAAASAQWGMPVTLVPYKDLDFADHCDLWLMPVGQRRVVVGSPVLAGRLLREAPAAQRDELRKALITRMRNAGAPIPAVLEANADFNASLLSQSTSARRLHAYLEVRKQITDLGYDCIEVPFLSLDPRAGGLRLVLSYTNVIQDERDGRRIVYLPTYAFPLLDHVAVETWRSLGYEVRTIDALGPGMHGGAVRCLSHVRKTP